MNFKKTTLTFFLFLYFTIFSNAQNLPDFSVPQSDTVIVNLQQNYLIISGITDGDSMQQQLSFEIASSNTEILAVDSVSYSAGNKMAVVWVSAKNVLGKVDLSVSLTNADGTTSKTFEVVVANYSNHGIKFEIHDAVFWQEVIPLEDTPVYGSVIQSTNMKAAYDKLDWNSIPLTVGAGCDNPSLCDGHDFNTGFIKGFLVPEISGNYSFYINGDSDYALFLSTNEKYENAKAIAAKSDNHGKIGALISGRKSDPVALEAGNVYAMYAVQWNVHNENGGVQWELPGQITQRYIDGINLYPEFDTQRPEKVKDLAINSIGDNFLGISWTASTDNQKLTGYHVYVNGQKVNSKLIETTDFLIENLDFETGYSIAVTAVDLVNNESFFSEIINGITYSEDTIPPTPPTNLKVDLATGLALQVSWDGASDDRTGIFGYNLFLNGGLYNPKNFIKTNSAILKVLEPETEYEIQLQAVDAGMNVSGKSEVFKVSTVKFNPVGENLGLKTGKLEISTNAISTNEGIGINTDFINGAIFNASHTNMLQDFKPGAIRWGALTANPLSFKDYAGAGRNVTIGKFFTRCNDLNSYTVFCCGVENKTDWINDPETFIRFLEYVNGPDDTPGGQLRLAEGFKEPFLKNSKGLIFEFGNEVWGADAHNAQIGSNYTTYAKWSRDMAAKMRASEYYDSTKIVLVYSARNPSRESSYGLNDKIIDGDKGEVDWTAPSGYIGGNLNYDPAFPPAKSELEYYENVRSRANEYLSGMVSSHKFEVEKTGRIFKQYMYESNTSTSTYNGRLGQALFSTDYYLTAMELGSAIPTIFHLTGGEWRITEQENNYRRLPLFLTAKYFNEFCKGDVLYNQYESNSGNKSGPGATFAQRPVGAHTYRNNGGYTLVLVSRDYEEDYFVQLKIPEDLKFKPEGKRISIAGVDFNTKNAVVDSTDIIIADEMVVKVPKHGMIFIRFDADSIKMTKLPMAHYIYPGMEELSIYAPKNTFSKANERLAFRAYVTPTQSWDNVVVWSLRNNSGNYSIEVVGTYCYVNSGNFVGNETDSLILKASNRMGDVFDEVVLHLPQIPVSADVLENNPGFKIYPNPAHEILHVELEVNDCVKIYAANGIKVFEKELVKGRNEIRLNQFSKGMYTLQIGTRTEKFLLTN